MKTIGCDFHLGYQQIAVLDLATAEIVEKSLSHERKEEVRAFYAGLRGPVRVGIEASGQSQWFERMLAELGHEVWIGDAAKIRASCERKQKTDRRTGDSCCNCSISWGPRSPRWTGRWPSRLMRDRRRGA